LLRLAATRYGQVYEKATTLRADMRTTDKTV